MAAYQDILSKAQGTAATPYTPYGGELVAGVNPQQSAGIANINSMWNYAQPYLQTAAGYATDAATPLTPAQIQQYMSPYTQDVVNATAAQFHNQNEQQRQGVVGNAISQGALGGNREAIAEAELANQQNLAQAPVISGLYNQAYTTGLNTALTEQQARAQGAYSLGNLGVSGQNAALTGANAQVGVGTLQQGTQQALDAAQYQQFINSLAYPFQTSQWLAGIGTGVGSQMGGTSTGPAPSLMAQLLGLGTAGVGAAGKAGLFGGTAGGSAAVSGGGDAIAALAPEAAMFLAGGGAVRRASGGVAPPEGPSTIPETPETLKLQQRQLLNGHRRVQMFPRGTPELPLPRGMNRTEHANGSFHYDPRRINEHDIHRLSSAGRENDMLDLGPYSKDDVLKRMQGGEVPVAVVERHPDGTEARAAIGTHTTADRQMAAMNRSKSPGHIVRVEDPRETIGHRLRAFGGRVPGFAGGGAPMGEAPPPTNGAGAVLTGTPYGPGSGWIPRMDVARGHGAPHGSAGVAPPPSLAQQAKEIGSLADLISNPRSAGVANANESAGDTQGPDEGPAMYRGGGVANLPFHHMVPHLADGGSPYDTDYFDDTFGAPIRRTNASYEIASDPDRLSAFRDRAGDNAFAAHPEYVPMPQRRPEGVAPGYDLPSEITAGASRPAGLVAPSYADEGSVRGFRRPSNSDQFVRGDEPSPLDDAAWPQGPVGSPGTDYAQERPSRTPPPQPRGVAPGMDFSADSKLWSPMMTAGLGMLASKSPFAGVAIGEGGLAGMQTYASERQREDKINSEVKKLGQEAEFAQKRLDLQTRQLDRPYSEQTANQKATLEETRRQHDILLAREVFTPIPNTFTEDGHPIGYDKRNPKQAVDMVTMTPLTDDQKKSASTGGWKPFADKTTAEGDPVLINKQGQTKNAVTGQALGPDTKLVSSKELQLSGMSADVRAHQLAAGDIKGAYAGLPFGSGGNRAKQQVGELARQKLIDSGMSPQEAGEYLSSQTQAYAATGSGLNSEARTAGVREANLKIILKAADAAIPAALEASQAVARTGWVPINQLIQKGEVIASNPELKEFGMANLQLAEHWARAMNPTGVMRETDRDMALKYLSTADSQPTYARAVAQLQKQINRELAAVHSVKTQGGFAAKMSDKDSTAGDARKELNAGVGSPSREPVVAPPTKREAGKTYPTPKGPMTWTGTGWVPPVNP